MADVYHDIDRDVESDKEALLGQLKEEFNIIQQKKAILKDHESIIKE